MRIDRIVLALALVSTLIGIWGALDAAVPRAGLSAMALALPATVIWLAPLLGRDPRLAILVMPFVFSRAFLDGADVLVPRRENLSQLLATLPERVILDRGGWAAPLCLILLASSWFLLANAGGRRRELPLLAFVVLGASYFMLGSHALLPLAAVAGALIPDGAIEGRRRLALLPAAIASIAYPIALVML
jgi:hypothetical protein